MNLEALRIALGGIIANKLRSSLTMLGIMIGVASVIILVAVGVRRSFGILRTVLYWGVVRTQQRHARPNKRSPARSPVMARPT